MSAPSIEWTSIVSFPALGIGCWRVWRRNFLYFRYTMWVSILWVFVEPTLYLVAFGYGLGAYIGNVNGLPYVEFFFPGLMASTAMLVSFFEATYGCYTKFDKQKTYQTILLSPLATDEVVLGEVMWAASKGFMSSLAVVLVATTQGLVHTWLVFPALVILALVALFFAALGMVMTSFARNYDWFVYAQTGMIVPMYLLSGTYFPLDKANALLSGLSWLLPLTHGVQAVRALIHEQVNSSLFLSAGLLFVGAIMLLNWGSQRMARKMIK